MLHLLFALTLGAPALVAGDSRCNDVTINAIEGRLRKIAGSSKAGRSQADLGAAILAAQSDIGQEQVILESTCSEADFRPYDARLYALGAWADLLTYTSNPPAPDCPDARKKIEAGTVADAWVKLGEAATVAPSPPRILSLVEPGVRSLASDAGVTLPAYGDATSYWAAPFQQAARDAVAACAK